MKRQWEYHRNFLHPTTTFPITSPAAINNWITTTFAFDFMLSCHVRSWVVGGQWFRSCHFFLPFDVNSAHRKSRIKFSNFFTPHIFDCFPHQKHLYTQRRHIMGERGDGIFQETRRKTAVEMRENWLISSNFDSPERRKTFFYALHRSGKQARVNLLQIYYSSSVMWT